MSQNKANFNFYLTSLIMFLILNNNIVFASELKIDHELSISMDDQKWNHGRSQVLFDKKLPVLQHKKLKKLVGHIYNDFRVMEVGKKFSMQDTLKQECHMMKNIYLSLNKNNQINHIEYKTVELMNHLQIPSCWIIRDNFLGTSVQIIIFNQREGKAKDISFNSYAFNFNFPTKVKKDAITELEFLLNKVQLGNYLVKN